MQDFGEGDYWPNIVNIHETFYQLTSLHLILQRCGAIGDQLLQWNSFVTELQVDQFLHVFGMMEIQDLLVSIIASIHVVQEDVDDLLEKLSRFWLSSFNVRQNIC